MQTDFVSCDRQKTVKSYFVSMVSRPAVIQKTVLSFFVPLAAWLVLTDVATCKVVQKIVISFLIRMIDADWYGDL